MEEPRAQRLWWKRWAGTRCGQRPERGGFLQELWLPYADATLMKDAVTLRNLHDAKSMRKAYLDRACVGKNGQYPPSLASGLGSRRHQLRRAKYAHALRISRCRHWPPRRQPRAHPPTLAPTLGGRRGALRHSRQDRGMMRNFLPRNEASSRSSRASFGEQLLPHPCTSHSVDLRKRAAAIGRSPARRGTRR